MCPLRYIVFAVSAIVALIVLVWGQEDQDKSLKERLNGEKRKYQKSAQQLQQWQAKQQAFDEWVRSPRTQKMTEAIGYLKQPERRHRQID